MLWIRAGVPLTTVRDLAGHASLATTNKYVRIARNDLVIAADAVNSYMAVVHGPSEKTPESPSD